MKNLVRDILINTRHWFSFSRLLSRSASRLFIATFHRVLPEPHRKDYPLPSLVVTPEELEWFIRFFLERFNCQRLDLAWADFVSGKPSNRPRLAITFDDGQLDNYLHALPVLQRLGVPATFFVPVEAVETQTLLWHDRMGYAIKHLGQYHPDLPLLPELGISVTEAISSPRVGVVNAKRWTNSQRYDWIKRAEESAKNIIPDWDGMMTWDQIIELSRLGHEIGSHSYSHPLLDTCASSELEWEVAGSRRIIEQKINNNVVSFCYPNGNVSPSVEAAVREAGYSLAVTTEWGSNTCDAAPYSLKRHDMVTANSLDRLGLLFAHRVEQRMLGFKREAR